MALQVPLGLRTVPATPASAVISSFFRVSEPSPAFAPRSLALRSLASTSWSSQSRRHASSSSTSRGLANMTPLGRSIRSGSGVMVASSMISRFFCSPPAWSSVTRSHQFGANGLSLSSSSLRSFSSIPTPSRQNINWVQLAQRRFFFADSRQKHLARLEATANNNRHSATSQNAFYSALLRANMPQIIVERYRSGRYATNSGCQAVYIRALQQLGQYDPVQGAPVVNNSNNIPPPVNGAGLSQQQLQAVSQAVAAQVSGGNIASPGPTQRSKTGERESPMYVVVEESIGSTLFRWVRFLLMFGFISYFLLLVLNVLVDTTGALRTTRPGQTSEVEPEKQNVRFDDVHGCDEAKEELREVVEFLQDPTRFSSLGGKLPKGVLLVGPPGTGKTLLARAVAGEAQVPFFYMSGSEFDEIYVGVGAKRVRELFQGAREKAPAIIFIDELDAIGSKRNERDAAYVKQTLNQLLTELDGFSQSTGVIILGATNYPQSLDKALTRPGRFDRKVDVPLPDVRGRVEILKHHMQDVKLGADVDASILARGTPGFSGADLENLVNQAAIHASKEKQTKVGLMDLEWAKDKIMMGAEARNRVLRESDKLATAYHEAGHALVAYFSPQATPLHKMTIVPRGFALGVTHFLPEMDTVSKTYAEFLAELDVAMGGKMAEELIYGPESVTTGISGDLSQATQVATAMVTEYGFSPKLGSVDLRSRYETLSSETKQEIESEVRRLLDEAAVRARTILIERRDELDVLTRALMEYETLTREEFEKVLRGEALEKTRLEAVHGRQDGNGGSGSSGGGGGGNGGNGGSGVSPLPGLPADSLAATAGRDGAGGGAGGVTSAASSSSSSLS